VVVVVLASLFGGFVALDTFSVERELSVGRIALSAEPGRDGALDLYVPLVDWGLRFDAIRAPVRLNVDVRSIDRKTARHVASRDGFDVAAIRHEARDAIAAYLRLLLLVSCAAAMVTGTLVALAIRGRAAPRVRVLVGVAAATAVAATALLTVLLPPRGSLGHPEYYANGPDIPVALRAIERANDSAQTLSEELDDQLVGLARMVSLPAQRSPLEPLPRITVASDLHNNLLALPTLRKAARSGPLFFVGDLTSSGSPLETQLLRRVAGIGEPFVFVSGNHDSDTVSRRLARAGAVVLTRRGRLRADGRHGPLVSRVAGLAVAGYDDPFERRRSSGYRERGDKPTAEQQEAFAAWLRPLAGRVDVVMVHSPALALPVLEELRADPPRRPLVVLMGHTHHQYVRATEQLVELNPGTAGGGGTGNLEKGQPIGLAVLIYARGAGFRPLAADSVEIDPGSGSASARRVRFELPPSDEAALAGLYTPPGRPMRRIETPAAAKVAGSRTPRPSTTARAPGRSAGASAR
jgi:predicted phosphodiesterase